MTTSSPPPNGLYLGIDIGTQSLKAIVLCPTSSTSSPKLNLFLPKPIKISYEALIQKYSLSTEDFGTAGIIKHSQTHSVESNPLLFILALRELLDELSREQQRHTTWRDGTLKIVGIASCAQQHGSVYWTRKDNVSTGQDTLSTTAAHSAEDLFSEIHSTSKTAVDVAKSFSTLHYKERYFLCNSPIWMDSSTTHECHEMEQLLQQKFSLDMAQTTGSRAYERFTGSQIRKRRHLLRICGAISLISGLGAWFFTGALGPVDLGDASGMNMMDIVQRRWSRQCLEAILSDGAQISMDALVALLQGEPVSASTRCGTVHSDIAQRYSSVFATNCCVFIGTGDNISSACGTLRHRGDACVSLGSSHTVFGFSSRHDAPPQEGHVFLSPWASGRERSESTFGEYLPLICIKNGGMVREKMCREVCGGDWDEFNSIVEQTAPSADYVGFYFLEPEIIPHTNSACVARFARRANDWVAVESNRWDKRDVKALIDSQTLQMYTHAKSLGLDDVQRIIVIGGAAENKHICQTLADVFGVPIFHHEVTSELASFGSAVRAYVSHQPRKGDYPDDALLNEVLKQLDLELLCEPDKQTHKEYMRIQNEYEKLEQGIGEES